MQFIYANRSSTISLKDVNGFIILAAIINRVVERVIKRELVVVNMDFLVRQSIFSVFLNGHQDQNSD